MIYIKHIPKDKLLWELWQDATVARHLTQCPQTQLSYRQARRDINFMILNDRPISVTTYYSRLLFVDISNDYFDPFSYDMYNGQGTAIKIINELKLSELRRAVLRFHII